MDTLKDTKMQPATDAVIEELRMLAEDLDLNGYIRYSSAMAQAADELECLRAKIAEMEQQKPVGTALLCARCSTPFDDNHYCPACGFHTAMEEYVYVLPGAKGEDK